MDQIPQIPIQETTSDMPSAPAPELIPAPTPPPLPLSTTPKPKRSMPKISAFGLVCLLALLVSFGALAYFFLQNQTLKSQMGLPTFKFPWTQVTCTYAGQTYQAGENVPSVDGCNSCSCAENGQVACTAMACISEDEQISDENILEEMKAQDQEYESDPVWFPPNNLALVNKKNGKIEYIEPTFGYSFSYSSSPSYLFKDCGNGRFNVYNQNLPLNSDDPCGPHGVAGLNVNGHPSRVTPERDSSCINEESSSWPSRLTTESIDGKEIIICKSVFDGERYFEGPDEYWSVFFIKDNKQAFIRIYDPELDLGLKDIFYQIISNFEFTDIQ